MPDSVVPSEWVERQRRMAARFPGFLRNAIEGRRESLGGSGKHARDPEARRWLADSLVELELLARELGVAV